MDRYTEAEERPKAFEEMGRQIQQYMKFVEAYKMKVKPWGENFFLKFSFRLHNIWRNLLASVHEVDANAAVWLFNLQDEQFDHLDEADVTKVDRLTCDVMMWMNSAMGQQSKMSLSVDPTVKVKDIQEKIRVSGDKHTFK